MMVDGVPRRVETHSIDLCKGRVACEVQWNSKDGVFSRSLRAFRLLHERDIISVGILVACSDLLREMIANRARSQVTKEQRQRIKSKYALTTHWSRAWDDDLGVCPLLFVGVRATENAPEQ
jgi:hypothetical protein